MKKYFLLLLLAVFTISCSKKVEVTGQIKGGSPLERIEFIDASGVATLPLINMGLDKDGKFQGNFEVEKDGMYMVTYAGRQNLIYLRKGEKLNLNGDNSNFPLVFLTQGNAKNDNDFIKSCQDFLQNYGSKLDFNKMIAMDETAFIKEVKKIQDTLSKNVEENAKKHNAGSSVIAWKKDDLEMTMIGLMAQYKMTHGMAIQNPSFKTSKIFEDFYNELNKNGDKLIKEIPMYRNLLLNDMSADFQKYVEKNQNNKLSGTENFLNFLKTRNELSQTAKDYLLSYVMSQSDISPSTPKDVQEKIAKIIDTEIKDSKVKQSLKQLQFVISGPKIGEEARVAKMIKQDGKEFSFSEVKGKPTLVVFYASWNPYIEQNMTPALTEVVNFYKSKMNFVYINVDDTKDQFVKTSNVLLKGLPGSKVYAEGGLNSDLAKKYGLYGFKLPSYMILDNNGKVNSHVFYNLGESEFVEQMDKVSGLKAPEVNQNATLQNDLLQQLTPKEEAEASKQK